MSLLTPTAYFPPATWFAAALEAGSWWIEAHEHYQKGGWRNRCELAGPNGRQTLSIPLEKGKHQQKPIQDVRICYRTDWWRAHEQAIRTAYGRSPYFEFYADALFAVGRSHPATLWELNFRLMTTLCTLIAFPVVPQPSATFTPRGSGIFLRETDLAAALLPYPQVFTDRHGYLPGLSILDALFCQGPMVARPKGPVI